MATITEVANATKPSAGVNSPATHQRDIPAARRVTVVERTTELSDEVLESLEAGQRAAIEAAGRFLVTVEEALPQEVQGTSKTITESGLEMADRPSSSSRARRVARGPGRRGPGKSLRTGWHRPGADAEEVPLDAR